MRFLRLHRHLGGRLLQYHPGSGNGCRGKVILPDRLVITRLGGDNYEVPCNSRELRATELHVGARTTGDEVRSPMELVPAVCLEDLCRS